MSTVVLDTITGKSTATTITIGSTPVVSASANSMTIRGEGSAQTSIQQGLCKMFVSINDAGSAIRNSFNVASYTDESNSVFTTTYTNSFSDAVYITTSGIRDGGGENDTRMIVGSTTVGYYATGSQRNFSCEHSVSANGVAQLNSAEYAMLASVGDLA